MSGELTVTVTDIDGVTKTYDPGKTADLTFIKERYTPFTYLKGTFIEEMTDKRPVEICLYYGSTLLHRGTADSAEYSVQRGTQKLRVTSYGYSKQLGQDYAEPGIITSPNLGTIIGGAGITGVTYQPNTNTVSYVYYEDKTTVWNAACIYTMKAYRKYPFIRGANTVLCSLAAADRREFVRSPQDMVSFGRGQELGNILSHVYTQDLDGNWTYNLRSIFAGEQNVTRKKYYPPDREFTYDLYDQLRYHMYFSNRGRQYIRAVFPGYLGEDICDTEQLTAPGYTGSPEISKLTVRATPKGVFTDMMFYFDSFCNTV